MAHSVLLFACRWLRQKLDSVERRAQLRDGTHREAQMRNRLDFRYDRTVNMQMHSGFQGHVADAAQHSLGRDELEKHYRGMSASQEGQFTPHVLLGRQVIGHSIPLYDGQQGSLTRGAAPDKPTTKRKRTA